HLSFDGHRRGRPPPEELESRRSLRTMVHSILRPGAALLEREAELAALDGALATARDGSGRLLLVEGPPGIGKTTLLAAARDHAHEDGFAVLDAVCDELEAAFPFGVAVQLLEPALRALGDR